MKWKILIVGILCLGILLKLHHYTEYPQRGATSDEYTYAFLGLSLLREKLPISWSYFSYPKQYDVTINGTHFPLVFPYFDHPPLAGIITGGWALLRGEDTFMKVSLATIRLVPIVSTSISAFLLFFLAKNLYGTQVGLWSLVIYSIVPLFVVSHRVAVSENILTALFLAALLVYTKMKRRFTAKGLFFLSLLSGISFWTKESGLAVFVSLFILLWQDRVKVQTLVRFTAPFFCLVMFYVIYGSLYDGALFWEIISIQSNRDIGPQTLWYLLSTPITINKIYQDGWYYFGFISAISLLWDRRHANITLPFFTYLILLVLTLTKEGQSGWYLIPLFPFLAIAAGYSIVTSIEKRSLYFLMFLLFIGLFLVQQFFVPVFGLVPFQLRLLTAILIVPILFGWRFLRKNEFQRLAYSWVTLLAFGTIVVTLIYKHPA